ncbi:hypothetical protein, unlikely [Trypanosoma brucei gambiense DAL972]|uniref:Uncharacterized protein n=1 Tax=Trypanosoma brucei gambiense (strain MHOM/CI/86/DAL972) TaxID=679716 RepID=C9ZP38_TRYB9|nr:hypothetical protein, unlikely [Trypanosoma brucei gambiense DAL972]CBH11166.1 hypothetical protein, unlikely [Trypanosoma brucei gambiense DAL972]|eukprot:XP_011773453.1 hypothetical protein, unlikely [Trypanosoma brucei gambiense DAL972]
MCFPPSRGSAKTSSLCPYWKVLDWFVFGPLMCPLFIVAYIGKKARNLIPQLYLIYIYVDFLLATSQLAFHLCTILCWFSLLFSLLSLKLILCFLAPFLVCQLNPSL